MKNWKQAIGCLSLLGMMFWNSGCATEAQYRSRVNSWRGKKAEELVRSWGAPDVTEKVKNNHKVLMFIRLKHAPYSYGEANRDIASLEAGNKNGGKPVLLHCPTYFEEDPHGRIISVEYRGDDCRWKD